jgi:hypothetical protein
MLLIINVEFKIDELFFVELQLALLDIIVKLEAVAATVAANGDKEQLVGLDGLLHISRKTFINNLLCFKGGQRTGYCNGKCAYE